MTADLSSFGCREALLLLLLNLFALAEKQASKKEAMGQPIARDQQSGSRRGIRWSLFRPCMMLVVDDGLVVGGCRCSC